MSQDYTTNVYDSTFSVQTTMENVEKNFAALKSAFSGSSAPSDPVAGMWWFDTSANILKLRNEANNAWQSVWNFASNKPVITNLSNEITGAMISSAIKDPAAGTAGLRTLGTGAQQAAAGNDSRFIDRYGAGDYLVISSDEKSATVTTATYTKVKEIKVKRMGTLRIKFTLIHGWSSGTIKVYGRIYRNGVAVGTERSITGGDADTEFSEDLSGWSVDDLCQIYAKGYNSDHSAAIKNFRLYSSIFQGEEVTLA